MKLYSDGTTKTIEYTEERLKIWEQRWGQNNPFSALKISNKEAEREKDFVGHIVPCSGDLENGSEVAYLLREDKWKQGYGYEAAGAIVLEYCPLLKHKGYNPPGHNEFEKIIATARGDNIASNIILKHLGFEIYKEEQKFGALRNHYTIDAIDSSEIINVWNPNSYTESTVITSVESSLMGYIV